MAHNLILVEENSRIFRKKKPLRLTVETMTCPFLILHHVQNHSRNQKGPRVSVKKQTLSTLGRIRGSKGNTFLLGQHYLIERGHPLLQWVEAVSSSSSSELSCQSL